MQRIVVIVAKVIQDKKCMVHVTMQAVCMYLRNGYTAGNSKFYAQILEKTRHLETILIDIRMNRLKSQEYFEIYSIDILHYIL